METKKASKKAWKHVICCLILLVIFVMTIGVHINAEGYPDEELGESSSDVVPLRASVSELVADLSYTEENEVELAGPKEEVTVEIIYDANYYITTYAETIEFFADVFGVDYEDVVADLYKRAENNDGKIESTNIGYLLNSKGKVKKYSSVEYGIVEYFYDYVERNPKKVSKKRDPYSGSAKYVENLIIYYTTHIYTNVDTSTALSIGAAESGYYKVGYMLRCNNIHGGMSSSGLIKYKNIEYGVLSYIRMLSKNYYGKGLDTISEIGRKYCPVYDDFDNKTASPHWKKLVNTAMKKYKNYDFNIEIEGLLGKSGNA